MGFKVSSIASLRGVGVPSGAAEHVAVPLCWPGLRECSTEVFQEVQSAGWVCLSVWLCLASRSYLPFPTTPFLAGEELLSSGHLHVGNLL